MDDMSLLWVYSTDTSMNNSGAVLPFKEALKIRSDMKLLTNYETSYGLLL